MISPIRIYHIDDNLADLQLSRSVLRESLEEASIETFTSATEALDALEGNDVDCIVSDYEMPETSGFEFLTEVRARDPRTPFIIFTGHGSEEIAEKALEAGATDYVRKTASLDCYTLLANRIRNAIERTEAITELEEIRDRFRALAESSSFGVVSIDERSTVLYANQAMESILGYTPDELVGESLLKIIPPRLHEAHLEAVTQYVTTRSRALDWDWITLPGQHKDGSEIPVGLSFGEARIEGELIFTSIIRDLREHDSTELATDSSVPE